MLKIPAGKLINVSPSSNVLLYVLVYHVVSEREDVAQNGYTELIFPGVGYDEMILQPE